MPRATLQALFDTILVSPVLTAHPTEVRRKSVLDREEEVAQLLAERDRHAADAARSSQRADNALSRAILTLWQTSLLRRGKPTVVDEVANGLSYYDHTFFRELPQLYADLEDGLAANDPSWSNTELPSFIRMGSWIGGDRDGNPFVNADVLRAGHRDAEQARVRFLSRRAASAGRRAVAQSRARQRVGAA